MQTNEKLYIGAVVWGNWNADRAVLAARKLKTAHKTVELSVISLQK